MVTGQPVSGWRPIYCHDFIVLLVNYFIEIFHSVTPWLLASPLAAGALFIVMTLLFC